MHDSTSRFSDRVENYVKYRPRYPQGVLDVLTSECGLTRDALIADIGSGTGISSRLFLENGNSVYAVEPNTEMRQAAEKQFEACSRFHSVNATAEQTQLPGDLFDLIIAGQAFHWFDRGAARQEFRRILKTAGWVLLLWNERKTDSSPFLVAYEEMLKELATDYQDVNHTQISEDDFKRFFAPHPHHFRTLPNSQTFDFEALKGRALSSSYCPREGDPGYEPMLIRLHEMFDAHQSEGTVVFEYDTNLYFGHLK